MLQAYFRSGWAFLIPYLAAYLLYAWLKWPVNPVASGPWTVVPCLLHVYWALHAIHFILGVIALRSWWLRGTLKIGKGSTANENFSDSTRSHIPPPALHRLQSTGYRLLPWVCLALVLWIPGIYLEWPSDPWEHLRRISQWGLQKDTHGHPAGYKGLYFLNYSIVALFPTTNLLGLSACSTLSSLLLAWQNYRLARALGLESRFAFGFVLLNCVSLGNSAFSFQRYYGLSTSIYAQIGVVAFGRLLLIGFDQAKPLPWSRRLRETVRVMVIACPLFALVARSHLQGLAMCALVLAATISWQVVRWGGWRMLLAMGVMINFAVLALWPRHAMIESMLVPSGWFSRLLAFNPDPDSMSGDRILAIIGIFGVIDLAAGLYLVSRNHLAGWLAITPIFGLLQPCVAIPLANFILEKNPGEILIFHRLLLASPVGLALLVAAERIFRDLPHFRITWGSTAVCAGLFAFTTASPAHPFYNRLWHALCVVPSDHSLSEEWATARTISAQPRGAKDLEVGTEPLAFLLDTLGSVSTHSRERRETLSPSALLNQRLALIASYGPSIHNPTSSETALISDWIALAGPAPETGRVELTNGFAAPTVRNPAGSRTEAFSRDLIRIDPTHDYWLEMTVRSLTPPPVRTLLAVVWYDEKLRPLPSHLPSPQGAGSPEGWTNGAYSYFALVDQPAPAIGTTYRMLIGPGGTARIPAVARHVRIGGILNHGESRDGLVELGNVRLWPHRPGDLVVAGTFTPGSQMITENELSALFTPGSQAARVSGHWNPYRASLDRAGTLEIGLALRHSQLRPWKNKEVSNSPP